MAKASCDLCVTGVRGKTSNMHFAAIPIYIGIILNIPALTFGSLSMQGNR